MERERRSSLQSGRKGKTQAPSQKSGRSGYGGQMVDPQKGQTQFKGAMTQSPHLMMADENDLVIDPNLLVGPLYVPETSKSSKMKAELDDITAKLHQTLYTFDEFDEYEPAEDPVFTMMKKQLGTIDDVNIRSNMSQFMNQYEGMSSELSSANKDREEMLFQLADWFTTDHVDLDDIKLSLDDNEEESIQSGYFETVTNFEKLKKLQSQMADNNQSGKPNWPLKKKKQEIEREVVGKFKLMKDMSIQTKKLTGEEAPWKYAAQEIVDMLQNVRTENAGDMAVIQKKMMEMVSQLDKQAVTIKSLTAELRDKKVIVRKLTDENGDMSSDMIILQTKFRRYEKDLAEAQKLIKQLHSQKLVENDYGGATEETNFICKSISKALTQIDKRDEPQQMSSDSALLRTQLREYQETLDSIKKEFGKASEDLGEMTIELEEKKAYIENMENENDKLRTEVKKFRQERRQSIAAGIAIPPPKPEDTHKCEHCKCHVSETDWELEIADLKKETDKKQEKVSYFKKCLADTELKLSEAFREISELRRERDITPPPPSTAPPPEEAPEKEKKVDFERPKSATKEPKVSKPKPRKEVKSRYLQNSKQERQPALPNPTEMSAYDRIIEAELGDVSHQQSRELKLYKAGDIQGKLNTLLVEIMEFVTDIGKMIYNDREDEGAKIQSMKAFSFGHETQSKKQKEPKDINQEEARQKKSQVIFSGQHACAKLKEAFDILSKALNLQHDEYEAIYRSFKISQQRTLIRKEVFMGRLPFSALQEFDKQQRQKIQDSYGTENMLSTYLNISYGGTRGPSVQSRPPTRYGGSMYGGRDSSTSITYQDGD